MFSTSLDILNLVLALCVFALTIFLCLALYNLIVSLQRVNKITKLLETGITKIDEVVTMAKDKLHSSSAYFMILVELAKKAMDFVQEKRGDLKEVKKTKKK